MFAFLLMAASLTDTVTMIEFNEFLRSDGSFGSQVIFYDWDYDLDMFVVVDWRWREDCPAIPIRSRGGYILEWSDRGKFRTVTASIIMHSKSRDDPEQENLKLFDRHLRRGLRR